LTGFQTYLPRLRIRRVTRTRRLTLSTPPLFPGYCFVWIELQWHAARWAPGVIRLVLDGAQPARVPERIITDLRGRERDGLVELPPPPPGLRPGDRVMVKRGPFQDQFGLYAGQAPRERVAVLLLWLGAQRSVELPAADVMAVPLS
jgi:transcriptional antiterminator RfaH